MLKSNVNLLPRFPDSSGCKKFHLQWGTPGFNPWVRKIPWRREWQPTPVFLPGKSHGQRSLVGYSPWVHKESDMTEQLTLWLLTCSQGGTCRGLAPGPSDQSFQCKRAVQTPQLGKPYAERFHPIPQFKMAAIQDGCSGPGAEMRHWTLHSVWKGQLALAREVCPQSWTFSSSALCPGEQQSPVCLPLGGLVATNSWRHLFLAGI